MNEEIQKQLNSLTNTFTADKPVTVGQVKSIVKGLAMVLIDNKQKAEKLNAQTINEVNSLLAVLEKEHEKLVAKVENQSKSAEAKVIAELTKTVADLKKEVRAAVKEIEETKPLDGLDADEDAVADKVLARLELPEIEEIEAEQIKEKLESLEGEERLDATAIKNLPQFVQDMSPRFVVSRFQDLQDTPGSYAGQNGKVLKVKSTEDGLEFGTDAAGTGDVVGPASSTDNAIARFDSTTGKLLQNSGPTITDGGELNMGAGSIGFTMQTATGDGTTTIDWKLGNHFDFTFGAQNETFTFTAPTKPGVYTLSLLQDSVGSRTATWPASVKWPAGTAPTLTTTATTGYDIIAFRFDGTNYYGTSTLDFS